MKTKEDEDDFFAESLECNDPITWQTLHHAVAKGKIVLGKGAQRVPVAVLTGVPLTSDGAPLAELLAMLWKVRGAERAALVRVARDWGCSTEEAKVRLVRAELLLVRGSAGEPWTGRIGSGDGSGKVSGAIPAEASFVGRLKWLAQVTLARAARALEDADPAVVASEMIDPGKKKVPNDAAPVSRDAPNLKELLLEVEAPALIFAAVRSEFGPAGSRYFDAVVRHLTAGLSHPEAKRAAAAELGVTETAVKVAFSKARKKLFG